jgi:hypothetical protein
MLLASGHSSLERRQRRGFGEPDFSIRTSDLATLNENFLEA